MRAEVLEMHDLNDEFSHESDTPLTQIVFPVQGLHYIGTGPREVLLDLNQSAFIPRGIVTKDRHPSLGDVVCIVVTPSPELLDEVWHGRDALLPDLLGDTCVIRPIEPVDQLRAGLLAKRACLEADNTAFEEILMGMLRRTVKPDDHPAARANSRSLTLVAKVKELLATAGELLSLSQIANAIGASPAYLTDLFHRIEGMPIYRYQTRLRLARALGQLPHAEDITQLALDLGFSSHSHFSSAFRSTFGITPSNYRALARSQNGHSALPANLS
jgi:AraC family transcriptional regulator